MYIKNGQLTARYDENKIFLCYGAVRGSLCTKIPFQKDKN